ncbi:MAG: hypothetical protein C4519_00295 [Desulfobacteraceae bacterium]|nr:MAG: hypothetical protein C4519_00295 [Desulfobacteraceae bacterium]
MWQNEVKMPGKNRSISIAGAGISGMTAAINLALNNFKVEVFDRRSTIGSQARGDFQGLENWTSPQDALVFLKQINIDTAFYHEPFKECVHYDYKLNKYNMHSDKVGFYLIRRGSMENTIDSYLYNKAINLGVQFHFNSDIGEINPNIIATGYEKPFLIATGINFDTNLEKIALGIFDDKVAPGGYAYLLGLNGHGTIAVVSKHTNHEINKFVPIAIERFSKIINFDIKNSIKFGGCGARFKDLHSGIPRTGESAGFQDAMWGFGLRMAFHSGYLAAKSIIENKNYWDLVKKEIVPYCRTSIVNRFIYDVIKARGFKFVISSMANSDDSVQRANQLYAPVPWKRIIYPIVNRLLK